MNWHQRLTEAREAKKIKKTAFAKLVGVSAPTVTEWENGNTKMIEGKNLLNVCEKLEISPDWLLYGKGSGSGGGLLGSGYLSAYFNKEVDKESGGGSGGGEFLRRDYGDEDGNPAISPNYIAQNPASHHLVDGLPEKLSAMVTLGNIDYEEAVLLHRFRMSSRVGKDQINVTAEYAPKDPLSVVHDQAKS